VIFLGIMFAFHNPVIVEMPQVFLPFATDAQGRTLYDKRREGKCLLRSGPEEYATEKTRRMRLHRLSEEVMQNVCLSLKEAPLGRVNSASLEMRDTVKVCRGVSESAREGTENTQNETLRHVELFPCLVYGFGVFVRPRDSRVCHRRGGHTRDHPHTPQHRYATL